MVFSIFAGFRRRSSSRILYRDTTVESAVELRGLHVYYRDSTMTILNIFHMMTIFATTMFVTRTLSSKGRFSRSLYVTCEIKLVIFFNLLFLYSHCFKYLRHSCRDTIASIAFLEGQGFTCVGIKESCMPGINCIQLSILILLSVFSDIHPNIPTQKVNELSSFPSIK